jgi:hypothetical protein
MKADTSSCLFLRECLCRKPGSGHCPRCDKLIEYSQDNRCFFCDCECDVETCTIKRNPTGVYFKVLSTENLFNKWKDLGLKISHLSYIVQNDMVIDKRELNEWLQIVGKLQKDFTSLVRETTAEIIRKKEV